jgi:hypothetical protein
VSLRRGAGLIHVKLPNMAQQWRGRGYDWRPDPTAGGRRAIPPLVQYVGQRSQIRVHHFCHAQLFEITLAENIRIPILVQHACQDAKVVEAFCVAYVVAH